MSGKGSRQRPTDRAKFNANWDLIFNKASQPTKELEDKDNGIRQTNKIQKGNVPTGD